MELGNCHLLRKLTQSQAYDLPALRSYTSHLPPTRTVRLNVQNDRIIQGPLLQTDFTGKSFNDWVQFYLNRKAVSASTKQTDLEHAKAFAEKWYAELIERLTV